LNLQLRRQLLHNAKYADSRFGAENSWPVKLHTRLCLRTRRRIHHNNTYPVTERIVTRHVVTTSGITQEMLTTQLSQFAEILLRQRNFFAAINAAPAPYSTGGSANNIAHPRRSGSSILCMGDGTPFPNHHKLSNRRMPTSGTVDNITTNSTSALAGIQLSEKTSVAGYSNDGADSRR